MALGNSIPYGLRDVKLVKYPTLAATAFGSTLVDLPVSRTFTFTDTEEYEELRGDDTLVTSHGQGTVVDWELESGGISFEAYAILSGGTIIESGITPNQVKRYRKKTTDQRPFFLVIGQAISDTGGDFKAVIWRCRSTDDLEGELSDGQFFIPKASGTGFGCLVTGLVGGLEVADSAYDFIQSETMAAITAPALDTPAAPVIYSLDDVAGGIAGGEIVNVTGYGFTGVTTVTVGGTAATDWQTNSVTSLTLIVPAKAAGPYDVVITTAAGASATGAQTKYTYS
jgi:IPT/TIG domain